MQPFKFTTIAHADHTFCNPLSEEKADRLLGLLPLITGDPVLDVGCGKGELLIRLVERFGVRGVGVDISPSFLADAEKRAAGRVPPGAIEFRCESATAFGSGKPGDFAAAICTGAVHALGTWSDALDGLTTRVRPGGVLLLGHGYWRQRPNPAYLQDLGVEVDAYLDHAGNVEAAEERGLIPLYTTASSLDEWDDYEGLYCRAVERYVRDHPQDPDAPEMCRRIRSWRRLYLRWGRDTLGMGFYLFQKA